MKILLSLGLALSAFMMDAQTDSSHSSSGEIEEQMQKLQNELGLWQKDMQRYLAKADTAEWRGSMKQELQKLNQRMEKLQEKYEKLESQSRQLSRQQSERLEASAESLERSMQKLDEGLNKLGHALEKLGESLEKWGENLEEKQKEEIED